MISARPILFTTGRPLGEEIKFAGASFYLHAPSGAPQDLTYTTDEQSHIRVPVQPGIVYNFPNGFNSLWLFHANSYAATDAQIVMATGINELSPSGATAYPGSGGPTKWAQGTATVGGVTAAGPVPAAGKRQRILSLTLSIPADSTLTAAGDVTCSFQILQGGVGTIFVGPLVTVPLTATALTELFAMTYNFGPTGVLGDVGARLSSVLGTTGTLPFLTGGVRWEMAYTEE